MLKRIPRQLFLTARGSASSVYSHPPVNLGFQAHLWCVNNVRTLGLHGQRHARGAPIRIAAKLHVTQFRWKQDTPKMDGLKWKVPLKCIIWGYSDFRKTSIWFCCDLACSCWRIRLSILFETNTNLPGCKGSGRSQTPNSSTSSGTTWALMAAS